MARKTSTGPITVPDPSRRACPANGEQPVVRRGGEIGHTGVHRRLGGHAQHHRGEPPVRRQVEVAAAAAARGPRRSGRRGQDRGHRRVDRHHAARSATWSTTWTSVLGAAAPEQVHQEGADQGVAALRDADALVDRDHVRGELVHPSNSSRIARHGISSPSRNSWANSWRSRVACAGASSMSGYISATRPDSRGRAGLQGERGRRARPSSPSFAGQLGRLARELEALVRGGRAPDAERHGEQACAAAAASSPSRRAIASASLAQRLALLRRRRCSRSRWPGRSSPGSERRCRPVAAGRSGPAQGASTTLVDLAVGPGLPQRLAW